MLARRADSGESRIRASRRLDAEPLRVTLSRRTRSLGTDDRGAGRSASSVRDTSAENISVNTNAAAIPGDTTSPRLQSTVFPKPRDVDKHGRHLLRPGCSRPGRPQPQLGPPPRPIGGVPPRHPPCSRRPIRPLPGRVRARRAGMDPAPQEPGRSPGPGPAFLAGELVSHQQSPRSLARASGG